MRASIAWCVIPVPVSPVVAYRSPWSERRLRSLVSPDSWLLRYGASSVGGVSWSFVRVFRRSLLPRSGLRSQWHLRGLVLDPSVSLLRSVSRSFSSLLRSVLRRVLGSVFSFDRVLASFGFWELGLQPSLSFRTVRFPLVPRFATEWCFVGFRSGIRSVLRSLWCFSRGSATVSCFVVGGWIGMRFDLLGPFVRSSRSRVFRRSLLPRSGLRSQSNPSVLFSIPRLLSFVPSRGSFS
jgi:hypothetical protein